MSAARWVIALASACALGLASQVQAQIKLGISGPLEGSNAGSMLEVVKGAEIYIDHVNQAGGVNGQRIQLVARHDNFEVEKTVAAVRKLITEDNVTALLLVRGTPHNQAILPLVEQYKVPLIGPSTGAMSFHKPVNRYVFNIRTPYQVEAEKLVALLKISGQHRIALLTVGDGFGRDVLVGLKRGLATAELQPTAVLEFDRVAAARDSQDFMVPLLPQLLKDEPDIVIVVGAGLAVKNALLAIRSVNNTTKVATLSNNASTAFIRMLGPHARGVIVSQVFPDEKSHMHPFVREARQIAARNKVTLTPGMMEGYAAAKVAVKGLKDAGGTPTRASLLRALDNMGNFDLGELRIAFSPSDHTGLEMADLSIITKDKGFLR